MFAVAAASALALGLAACGGDDEGDTDTGPDEAAVAEFCSSLADLSMAISQAQSVTDSTSQTELQQINAAIGGAMDSVSLAAQGAEVNTDEALAAVQSAQPQITALAEEQSPEGRAALEDALEPAVAEVDALEQENCQDVPESGA